MTKHELLDYMSNSGQVTIYEVAEYFGCTHTNIAVSLAILKRQNTVKCIGKIQYIKNVRPRKIFALTDNGLQKLEYFDKNGCKNRNCSCQKET